MSSPVLRVHSLSLLFRLQLLLFLLVTSRQFLLLVSVRGCDSLTTLFAGMLLVQFLPLRRLPIAQLLPLSLLTSLHLLRLTLSACSSTHRSSAGAELGDVLSGCDRWPSMVGCRAK